MHSNQSKNLSRRHFLALAATASAATVVGVPALATPAAEGAVSLAGSWRFRLDREDAGLGNQWFAAPLATTDKIQLPGILQLQGYGNEITAETPFVAALPRDMAWYKKPEYARYTKPGAVKVPYLSQPVRHYLGVAWYEREIEIPPSWRGQRVELTLERARWETTLFVDGQKLGSCRSLVAPHEYDLGLLKPGRHRVAIRIDNRMILPYRPDGHSVSDGEGGTWNGVVGRIELRATPAVWLGDVQVYPELASHSAEVRVKIGNATQTAGHGTLAVAASSIPVEWTATGGEARMRVALPNAKPWSEFDAALTTLEVKLTSPHGTHSHSVRFGMRQIKTDGKQIRLNGELLHLRATHDGGGFPLTGYPATDVASWKRIITTCQQWGMNAIRFHSWCPPEAAFTAADELGFYLQPECGMWNSFDTEGKMLAVLNDETERLLRAYGNHPSMILLNATNEPAGHYTEQLPEWDRKWRAADPRRLYADGTGRAAVPPAGEPYASDYLAANHLPTDHAPGRGPSGWFGSDYELGWHALPIPVVGHETGQWCAYPDFDVIKKFTGYMVPGNYEIWRDSAEENGLLKQNKQLAHASGRFQLACYKEDIEANLRTPSYSGFELLDLHDYLGQGGALIGVLDAFWEPKGYATPAEFRQFNNTTVMLARLKERVYTTSDTLKAAVEMAHYGAHPLAHAVPSWKVVDERGAVVASAQWPSRAIPRGKNISVGDVVVDLQKLPAPAHYKLVVELAGETTSQNQWDFWVYPAAQALAATPGITLARDWKTAHLALQRGERVLFEPGHVPADAPKMTTVPTFWNRLMNPNGAWMLGLLCAASHPALAQFPTQEHCDWQWIDVAADAPALRMNEIAPEITPLVQPIDDWNRNWKLALVFECCVGQGRLMVSTINLNSKRPGAAALRQSLLSYMSGEKFAPTVQVDAARLQAVFEAEARQTARPGEATSPDIDDPGGIRTKPQR